tara:strand:+ start:3408 stop:3971 length:564 start_codon:yes stop_codon:yes gene_type:complete
MDNNLLVIIPIYTNINIQICVNPKYDYNYYTHQMQIYASYDNHIPSGFLTIKCKKQLIKEHELEILKILPSQPNSLRLLKTQETTDTNYFIYIAVYNEKPFLLDSTCFKGAWKTYLHTYEPWDLNDVNQNVDENDDEYEAEYEYINVYDLIMDETNMNQHHMNTIYPLHSNTSIQHITLQEICQFLI